MKINKYLIEVKDIVIIRRHNFINCSSIRIFTKISYRVKNSNFKSIQDIRYIIYLENYFNYLG